MGRGCGHRCGEKSKSASFRKKRRGRSLLRDVRCRFNSRTDHPAGLVPPAFNRRDAMRSKTRLWEATLLLALLPVVVEAQVTQADYERAASLRTRFQGLALNIVDRSNWIGKTSRFWYRKSVKGGNEFVVID